MLSNKDFRRIDLWEDVPPAEMWKRYKQGIDEMVDTLFDSARPRAFVDVRDDMTLVKGRE